MSLHPVRGNSSLGELLACRRLYVLPQERGFDRPVLNLAEWSGRVVAPVGVWQR